VFFADAVYALCAAAPVQYVQQLHSQQQQQLRLSRQLGRRMRGDLLLLQDPQQHLEKLLPSETFLAAGAEAAAEIGRSTFLQDTRDFVTQLVTIAYIPASCRQATAALQSAAALQLTVELLLQATLCWQQEFYSLPEEQRKLLQADDHAGLVSSAGSGESADGSAAAGAAAAEDASISDAVRSLLVKCCHLLQGHLDHLWTGGQWQPQMQLLQQGGGEQLLQGLTLAVHCCSLDAQTQQDLVAFYGRAAPVWQLRIFLPGELSN
jgi:hypothetical protein